MTVIIATWDAGDVLGPCLDTVLAQRLDGGFETIVVDNASTDATQELLAHYSGRVRVLANDRNTGFSAACNQGAREANGEILLFLNPDTELIGERVLERLARAAEDPTVGLAGPRLLNPDMTLQPSCVAHPSVSRALLISTGMHRLVPRRVLVRIAPEFWPHDHPIDTGWLMGAALAVRSEVFRDLGGFCPTMYAEDQDLALRARKRGLRVRFESSAEIVHLANHSGAKRWSDQERAARVASAELELLRTHYGRVRGFAIRAIVGAGYAVRAVAHAILRRRARSGVYGSMARIYGSRG